MTYFLEQLSNGLAIGSVYALIAIGYSLVYSILYLINFAHGYVIMVGAFVALTLFGMEVPAVAALTAACFVGAALGVAVEQIAYRPVRSSNRIVPMISALGAGLVLSALAQLIWGPEVHAFPQLMPRGAVSALGVTVPLQSLIILGKTIFFACIFVWVRWTLPRFRYDQIMALGWKVMLNIALVNLLLTAIVVKLIKSLS